MEPVFLRSISLVNFKSYPELEVGLSANVNCFTGRNGIGKTNLLDAIYYLSFCKSFFNPVDVQNIRDGEEFFVVQGQYQLHGEKENIYCGNQRGKKKVFRRNKKEYQRLADHIGLLPLVMVSPADTNLILEGSETRRKFMDGVIAQYNKPYLGTLLAYNKAVTQRNALLKQFHETGSFDQSALEIWDVQLDEFGQQIYEERKRFLEGFVPTFQEFYKRICGENEEVSLKYGSQLHEEKLIGLLEQNVAKDRAAKYSTQGVHKDDLEFLIGGKPLKKFGSQGQQKTFVTALKMAQFHYMADKKQVKSVLLLDDVFDKLDEERVKAIMKMVSGEEFGQIFVTDTSINRINRLFDNIEQEVFIFKLDEKGITKTGQT